jgi:hypothetical protein
VDLWDLTRLLIRRWYFAVPMLLASVAAVVVAAQTVSPDYKSLGYMQLIPAPSAGKPLDPDAKPRPANPWNDLGYAALGNAAALTVTDPTTLERLADEGYSDSVTVVLNERTPLFEIEAVGNSKEQSAATVKYVIELLQNDIAAKQKQYGTLAEDTISTLVINDGSSPEQDGGKVKRVLIVAAGLGLLLTMASTIALDYWLRRRSRRRAEEDAPEDNAEVTSRPVPTGTREAPEPPRATAIPEPPRATAIPESTERTRRLHTARQEPRKPAHPPEPRKPVQQNGNVYSGERRAAEVSPDATVVLPAPHQARRTTEKRP